MCEDRSKRVFRSRADSFPMGRDAPRIRVSTVTRERGSRGARRIHERLDASRNGTRFRATNGEKIGRLPIEVSWQKIDNVRLALQWRSFHEGKEFRAKKLVARRRRIFSAILRYSVEQRRTRRVSRVSRNDSDCLEKIKIDDAVTIPWTSRGEKTRFPRERNANGRSSKRGSNRSNCESIALVGSGLRLRRAFKSIGSLGYRYWYTW